MTRALEDIADWAYAPAPQATDVVRIAAGERAVHRRRVRPGRRRAAVRDGQPGHRGAAGPGGRGGPGRRRPGGGRRDHGLRAGLGADAGPGAGQVPVPHRPDHPGAGPRVRRAGEPGQRQADPRVAGRGRAAGRRALLLLRGLGGQAGVRRAGPGAAAARRGRAGHPLELPAADGGLEAGAGAGRGQHLRAQAGRDHAADRAAAGRGLPAGGAAAGRGQRADRGRGRGRGAGRPPRRAQGGVHRLHRGGQGDRPSRWPAPARS